MPDFLGPWSVSSFVGGRFPAVNPVFFADNNRIAVVTALGLRLYSLNTKQAIAKIPFDASDVAQLYLSTSGQLFYLVHSTGSCQTVGVSDNTLTPLQFSKKIHRILTNNGDKILAVYREAGGLALGWFIKTELDESLQELHVSSGAELIAVSNNKEYVAFASRHDKDKTLIEIYNVSDASVTAIVRERRTTALAVSNSGLIAAGGHSGVIDVYYEQGVRSLKWHLSEVRALEFSLGEEYLLSGGKEKVAVFWQMQTDRQQFLPRLSGEITQIAVNASSTLYGLTLSDSQLVVLSASDLISRLQVSGVNAFFSKLPGDADKERKRLKKAKSRGTGKSIPDYTTSVSLHPGTRNCYFYAGSLSKSGPGSQVYVYNPQRDEQDSELSLARAIQQGRVRKEEMLSDPSVSHLKFTSDGQWMVTVDVKLNSQIDALVSRNDSETNLKFWKLTDDNSWSLVSRIVAPHGAERTIAAVCCSPNDHSVLTAADDGSLRLWRPNSKTEKWGIRKILLPFATTSRAVAVNWSQDKSIIVLGFETSIFLVDAKGFKIISALPNILGTRVRGLWFVGKHLVALAKSRLLVWDLVSSSQVWSIKVEVPLNAARLLAVDEVAGRFALGVNYITSNFKVHSRILLFDVQSYIPVRSLFHPDAVGAVQLVPGTSNFCFVDTRGVISFIASGSGSNEKDLPSVERKLLALSNQARIVKDTEHLEQADTRRLDINSFDGVFENNFASMDTLFARVLSIVNPAD